MPTIALGIGSNLGDRARLLSDAVRQLQVDVLERAVCSRFLETPAVDCEPGAPPFLNAAVIGYTSLDPLLLLDRCQQMESAFGRPPCRQRRDHHHSRHLDIDILLIDEQEIDHPRLLVPHPKLCQRRFFLEPLFEVAPDWQIPSCGCSVREALKRLGDGSC